MFLFDNSQYFRADIKESSLESLYDHQSLKHLLQDGSNRGVVLSSEKIESLLEASQGTFKHTELTEQLISDHIVYWFTRNNFIFESFNRKVSQLVESGLAKKYINEFMKKHPKVPERNDITFDQMTAGTQVLLLLVMTVTLSCIGEFAINIW